MARSALTEQVQEAVRAHLSPGDCAVDATVGNGRDTWFLAQQVGDSGTVTGFDIQPAAVERARQYLQEQGAAQRVVLHSCSHERMADKLTEECRARLRVVMFNLGYLPDSDKACITRPGSTLAALGQAFSLLQPGGLISVMAYTGHEGGREEADAVIDWAASLPADQAGVAVRRLPNPARPAPEIVLVEKR